MTKEMWSKLQQGDIMWFAPGEQTKLHGNVRLTVLYPPAENDGWVTYAWKDAHLTERRGCSDDPSQFANKVLR